MELKAFLNFETSNFKNKKEFKKSRPLKEVMKTLRLKIKKCFEFNQIRMTQKLVRQSLSFLNMTVIQPSAANVLSTAQGSRHLLCLPCLLVACGGMHCLLPHIILIVDKFYTGWRITHLGPGLG